MTTSITVKRDRLAALVLIGAFTIYLSQMRHLPTPVLDGADAGPALYGIGITVVSYLFLANLALRSTSEETITFNRRRIGQIIGFAVASFVYVYLLFLIGFFVASPVYAFAVMLIFDLSSINKLEAVIVSVITTAAVFVLFEFVFSIRLPMGVFG